MNQLDPNLSKKVCESIQQIIQIMQETPDLVSDVLPFMNGSLLKIQQLSTYDNNQYEVMYNLIQLATNYIPKTIHSYLSLPIDYRNSKAIKGDKTARDLLIIDLSLIKKQIYELESVIFSDIEKNIRVNSNLLQSKFPTQMELATQIENQPQDAFINQFEIQKYTGSEYFFNSFNLKDNPKKSLTPLSNKLKQTKKTAASFFSFVLEKSTRLAKYIYKKINEIFAFFIDIGILLIPIGLILGVIYGFGYFIFYSIRQTTFQHDITQNITQIYNILGTNQMQPALLANFINKDFEQLIDNSSYRKKYLQYNLNGTNTTIHLTNINKSFCLSLIDIDAMNQSPTHVTVNNIPLSEQNFFSDYKIYKNKNHDLCYLDQNNLSVQIDAKSVYQDSLAQKNNDPIWLQDKLGRISQNLLTLDNLFIAHKNDSQGEYYKKTIDTLKEQQDVYQKLLKQEIK